MNYHRGNGKRWIIPRNRNNWNSRFRGYSQEIWRPQNSSHSNRFRFDNPHGFNPSYRGAFPNQSNQTYQGFHTPWHNESRTSDSNVVDHCNPIEQNQDIEENLFVRRPQKKQQKNPENEELLQVQEPELKSPINQITAYTRNDEQLVSSSNTSSTPNQVDASSDEETHISRIENTPQAKTGLKDKLISELLRKNKAKIQEILSNPQQSNKYKAAFDAINKEKRLTTFNELQLKYPRSQPPPGNSSLLNAENSIKLEQLPPDIVDKIESLLGIEGLEFMESTVKEKTTTQSAPRLSKTFVNQESSGESNIAELAFIQCIKSEKNSPVKDPGTPTALTEALTLASPKRELHFDDLASGLNFQTQNSNESGYAVNSADNTDKSHNDNLSEVFQAISGINDNLNVRNQVQAETIDNSLCSSSEVPLIKSNEFKSLTDQTVKRAETDLSQQITRFRTRAAKITNSSNNKDVKVPCEKFIQNTSDQISAHKPQNQEIIEQTKNSTKEFVTAIPVSNCTSKDIEAIPPTLNLADSIEPVKDASTTLKISETSFSNISTVVTNVPADNNKLNKAYKPGPKSKRLVPSSSEQESSCALLHSKTKTLDKSKELNNHIENVVHINNDQDLKKSIEPKIIEAGESVGTECNTNILKETETRDAVIAPAPSDQCFDTAMSINTDCTSEKTIESSKSTSRDGIDSETSAIGKCTTCTSHQEQLLQNSDKDILQQMYDIEKQILELQKAKMKIYDKFVCASTKFLAQNIPIDTDKQSLQTANDRDTKKSSQNDSSSRNSSEHKTDSKNKKYKDSKKIDSIEAKGEYATGKGEEDGRQSATKRHCEHKHYEHKHGKRKRRKSSPVSPRTTKHYRSRTETDSSVGKSHSMKNVKESSSYKRENINSKTEKSSVAKKKTLAKIQTDQTNTTEAEPDKPIKPNSVVSKICDTSIGTDTPSCDITNIDQVNVESDQMNNKKQVQNNKCKRKSDAVITPIETPNKKINNTSNSKPQISNNINALGPVITNLQSPQSRMSTRNTKKAINSTPVLTPPSTVTHEVITEHLMSKNDSTGQNKCADNTMINPIQNISSLPPISDTSKITSKLKFKLKPCSVNLSRIDLLNLEKYGITLSKDCKKSEGGAHFTPMDTTSEINAHDLKMSDSISAQPVSDESTKNIKSCADIDLNETASISFSKHREPVVALQVYKSNILAASEDGCIYYYHMDTGALEGTFSKHYGAVTGIDVHRDVLYSIGLDSRLQHLDIGAILQNKPAQSRLNLLTKLSGPAQTLCIAWDQVYIGTRTGCVDVYDISKSELLPSLKASDSSILSLVCAREGPRKIILVASKEKTLSVRDAQTGLLLRQMLQTSTSFCSTLSNIPAIYCLLLCKHKIYCGTSGTNIEVYNFTSGEHIYAWAGGRGAVCLQGSKGLLFSGCYDGNIYVHRMATGEMIGKMKGPGKMLLCICIVDQRIVAGTKDNALVLWKIPNDISKEMTS